MTKKEAVLQVEMFKIAVKIEEERGGESQGPLYESLSIVLDMAKENIAQTLSKATLGKMQKKELSK